MALSAEVTVIVSATVPVSPSFGVTVKSAVSCGARAEAERAEFVTKDDELDEEDEDFDDDAEEENENGD